MTEQQIYKPSSALTLYHLSQILPFCSVLCGFLLICEVEPDWLNFPSDFFSVLTVWNSKVTTSAKRFKMQANNSPSIISRLYFSFTAVKDNSKRSIYHNHLTRQQSALPLLSLNPCDKLLNRSFPLLHVSPTFTKIHTVEPNKLPESISFIKSAKTSFLLVNSWSFAFQSFYDKGKIVLFATSRAIYTWNQPPFSPMYSITFTVPLVSFKTKIGTQYLKMSINARVVSFPRNTSTIRAEHFVISKANLSRSEPSTKSNPKNQGKQTEEKQPLLSQTPGQTNHSLQPGLIDAFRTFKTLFKFFHFP